MIEKLGSEGSKEAMPILNVETGKFFKPFVGLRLKKDLNEFKIEKVAEIPFQFKGIKGKLDVYTNSQDEPSGMQETPFGKVKRTVIFNGRKKNLAALPIEVEATFNIRSIDEYDALRRCVIKFALGKRTRFLRFGGPMYNSTREYVEKDLERIGYCRVYFPDWSKSENKLKTTDVWLPFDKRKLSQIRAQIVEK